MHNKNYVDFGIEEFVLDEYFQQWVEHPDAEKDQFWSDFQEQNPGKRAEIRGSILIVKAFKAEEPAVPEEALHAIFEKIHPVARPVRTFRFSFPKVAATLLVLFSIAGLLYYFQEAGRLNLPESMTENVTGNGRIVFPDGSVREFDAERSTIQQTAAGSLKINEDTIEQHAAMAEAGKPALNQVIIPYGKRSEVTLSDGTHIWLNSGSQLSYPVVFAENSREVFLSGEAFFDVQKDPARPFTVVTKDLKVTVLGTRFNISSFNNDQTTQAVLVTGRITASQNKLFSANHELLPGERIVYDRTEDHITRDKVDVELYTSWINGYLIFRNEPVTGVIKKLERSYNQKILMEQGFENITFSGKLDLIEDFDNVLENISFTSSFSIQKENEVYTIKPSGQ